MVSEPAAGGAVPEYVATPDAPSATVCVAAPIVNTIFPVGIVDPLTAATVAVRVYAEPAGKGPAGTTLSVVVVATGTTDSVRVCELLETNSVDPW